MNCTFLSIVHKRCLEQWCVHVDHHILEHKSKQGVPHVKAKGTVIICSAVSGSVEQHTQATNSLHSHSTIKELTLIGQVTLCEEVLMHSSRCLDQWFCSIVTFVQINEQCKHEQINYERDCSSSRK